MTRDDELAWYRDWRARVGSAFRLWRDPANYEEACKRWAVLAALFKEQPPVNQEGESQ